MNNLEKVLLLSDKKISEMSKKEIKKVEDIIQIFASNEIDGRSYHANQEMMINGIYSYKRDLSYPKYFDDYNYKITHKKDIHKLNYFDEYDRIYDFITNNYIGVTTDYITSIQYTTFKYVKGYSSKSYSNEIDTINVTGDFKIIENDIKYYSFMSDNKKYVIPINRVVGVKYKNRIYDIDLNFKDDRSFPTEIISEQQYNNKGLKDLGFNEDTSIDEIGYFKLLEISEKMKEEQKKESERIRKEIEEKERIKIEKQKEIERLAKIEKEKYEKIELQ